MTKKKIPKIVHYCWFGGNEKPDLIKKCIASWKNHLTDYQIMEWNEKSFDIDTNQFVREAYEAKKFAFVSDYVRVHALYHFGGIYLDTDVEIFRPFDDLLHHDSFWGFEQGNYIATSTIGSAKENPLIKKFLDSYYNKAFIKEDGTFDNLTNVAIVTKMLEDFGLKKNGEFQVIDEIGAFYPQAYFSPYDYINCRMLFSEATYTVHYFHKSWLPPMERFKSNLKMALSKVVGGENIARFRKLVSKS
ncbi:glycosyltransferase family 32 protein [Alteribacter populi]|uniref:glycosyltransferase family 32 protein n=1 Tax=Alteribacter populi TaxID=2011011 RepID=UPI000BBA6DE5|nr:glycosyltransferase [Alteribacter populi]